MNKTSFGLLLLFVGLIAGYLLSRPISSTEIWKIRMDSTIPLYPVKIDQDVFFFLENNQLVKVNSSGKTTATVKLSSPCTQPLVTVASTVITADAEGHITGFDAADLSRKWVCPLPTNQFMTPHALPGNKLLVGDISGAIGVLEMQSGTPVWQARLNGEIVQLMPGKTLACSYRFTGVKDPTNMLTALSLETGKPLWSFGGSHDGGPLLAFFDYFVFCNQSGRPMFVDQITGEVRYKFDGDGYKIAGLTQKSLLLLAAGGSQFECLSLTTGKSWSATLPSPLLQVFGRDEAIILVDGKSMRSIREIDGLIQWQIDLGKTFNAFSIPSGICVSYKESFIGPNTFCGCFRPVDGALRWQCSDETFFWHPYSLANGDIVACRTGAVRLMARTTVTSAASDSDKLPLILPDAQLLTASGVFFLKDPAVPSPSGDTQ